VHRLGKFFWDKKLKSAIRDNEKPLKADSLPELFLIYQISLDSCQIQNPADIITVPQKKKIPTN
jgi:hypothetical protein